jgi:CheY-like chemotaxis protein
MSRPLRVLIVDDHPIVREGLRAVLEERDLLVVGEATSGDEALVRARTLAPDVVLMDWVIPGLPATEAIRQLRQVLPSVQVLVLTVFITEQQVRTAVEPLRGYGEGLREHRAGEVGGRGPHASGGVRGQARLGRLIAGDQALVLTAEAKRAKTSAAKARFASRHSASACG